MYDTHHLTTPGAIVRHQRASNTYVSHATVRRFAFEYAVGKLGTGAKTIDLADLADEVAGYVCETLGIVPWNADDTSRLHDALLHADLGVPD